MTPARRQKEALCLCPTAGFRFNRPAQAIVGDLLERLCKAFHWQGRQETPADGQLCFGSVGFPRFNRPEFQLRPLLCIAPMGRSFQANHLGANLQAGCPTGLARRAWHFDLGCPKPRLLSDLGKEPAFFQFTVILCPHQELHLRRLLLGVGKEFVEISLPIRYRDDLGGWPAALGRLLAAGQALQPSNAFALRGLCGPPSFQRLLFAQITLHIEHSERACLRVNRQGRMTIETLVVALVGANAAQALLGSLRGKIQRRRILHRQHHRPLPHALDRALPMSAQEVIGFNGRSKESIRRFGRRPTAAGCVDGSLRLSHEILGDCLHASNLSRIFEFGLGKLIFDP